MAIERWWQYLAISYLSIAAFLYLILLIIDFKYNYISFNYYHGEDLADKIYYYNWRSSKFYW